MDTRVERVLEGLFPGEVALARLIVDVRNLEARVAVLEGKPVEAVPADVIDRTCEVCGKEARGDGVWTYCEEGRPTRFFHGACQTFGVLPEAK